MQMFYKHARVEYVPLGVVGAIVPWNYPFHNIFNPLTAALFAGNAIVIKARAGGVWWAPGGRCARCGAAGGPLTGAGGPLMGAEHAAALPVGPGGRCAHCWWALACAAPHVPAVSLPPPAPAPPCARCVCRCRSMPPGAPSTTSGSSMRPWRRRAPPPTSCRHGLLPPAPAAATAAGTAAALLRPLPPAAARLLAACLLSRQRCAAAGAHPLARPISPAAAWGLDRACRRAHLPCSAAHPMSRL